MKSAQPASIDLTPSAASTSSSVIHASADEEASKSNEESVPDYNASATGPKGPNYLSSEYSWLQEGSIHTGRVLWITKRLGGVMVQIQNLCSATDHAHPPPPHNDSSEGSRSALGMIHFTNVTGRKDGMDSQDAMNLIRRLFSPGDPVNVKVLNIESNKIFLSTRHLESFSGQIVDRPTSIFPSKTQDSLLEGSAAKPSPLPPPPPSPSPSPPSPHPPPSPLPTPSSAPPELSLSIATSSSISSDPTTESDPNSVSSNKTVSSPPPPSSTPQPSSAPFSLKLQERPARISPPLPPPPHSSPSGQPCPPSSSPSTPKATTYIKMTPPSRSKDKILYRLTPALRKDATAAGVCFYCFFPPASYPDDPTLNGPELKVLMVRERSKNVRGSGWGFLGGKRKSKVDANGKMTKETAEETAAREVQEETHDLLSKEQVLALLGSQTSPLQKDALTVDEINNDNELSAISGVDVHDGEDAASLPELTSEARPDHLNGDKGQSLSQPELMIEELTIGSNSDHLEPSKSTSRSVRHHYWRNGKFALFLCETPLSVAEDLPMKFKEQIKGGKINPEAVNCRELGWFSLKEIRTKNRIQRMRIKPTIYTSLTEEAEEWMKKIEALTTSAEDNIDDKELHATEAQSGVIEKGKEEEEKEDLSIVGENAIDEGEGDTSIRRATSKMLQEIYPWLVRVAIEEESRIQPVEGKE